VCKRIVVIDPYSPLPCVCGARYPPARSFAAATVSHASFSSLTDARNHFLNEESGIYRVYMEKNLWVAETDLRPHVQFVISRSVFTLDRIQNYSILGIG
jgi:hypothetical protein